MKKGNTALMIISGFFLIAAAVMSMPHNAYGEAAEYQKGFPTSVSGDVQSQIKVADIDGDGKKELVVGSSDGMIHIMGNDGREKRFGLWPKQTGGPIISPVAIGDTKNDGKLRIVTGSMDGKVYCVDRYGKTEWSYDTKGSIKHSAPQLYDSGGDNKLKTFIGSTSGRVVRLDEDGNVEWQTNMGAGVISTVRVMDMDNKNKTDLVVRDKNGQVSIFTDGQMKPGWPQTIGPKSGDWAFELNVMDINKDGHSEVVGQTPLPYSLKVYDSAGNVKNTMPLPGKSYAQVRMADIDKDGELDMVITYNKPEENEAYIDIRNQKGESISGWPKKVGTYMADTPQVADVNGDGDPEIIFTAWTDDAREKAGYVNVLNTRGEPIPGFPKFVGKSYAPVTLSDIDDDGRVELIVAGGVALTSPGIHVFKVPAAPPVKIVVLGSQFENF